jgi:hypothetical protein
MISLLLLSLLINSAPVTVPTNQWVSGDLGVNSLRPVDVDFKRMHEGAPALTIGLGYTRFLSKYSVVGINLTNSSSFHLVQQTPSVQSLNFGIGSGLSYQKVAGVAYVALGGASHTDNPGCHPEAWDCRDVVGAYFTPQLQLRAELLGFPTESLGIGPVGSLNFAFINIYYTIGVMTAFRW